MIIHPRLLLVLSQVMDLTTSNQTRTIDVQTEAHHYWLSSLCIPILQLV
jgi:hypothetical protein